ncbi:hypothetical protein GCM10010840_27880 [Deinococcus aerolatus]|uniref:Uncharacterized protein n=1 Tax=Deinococcus aerolatus TaxID=522487 RepID=A0ABQ2GD46_9DEIO|nr:hypothetical protein [Deinococcus aerolatus]GGL88249.1 hypothetical protein GCM10010840_27880 [Deinococcus aerolatus]
MPSKMMDDELDPAGDRWPAWVAIFTCMCAGGGLALNSTMNDTGAFTLALLMASVAVAAVAWRVWGK